MATYNNNNQRDSSSTPFLYSPNSCSDTPPIHQGNIIAPIYTDSIRPIRPPLNTNTSQQQALLDFGQPQDNNMEEEMLMANSRIVQNDLNLQSQGLLSLSLSTQQLPSEWGRNLVSIDDSFHNKQSRDHTADNYMLVSAPRNDATIYGGIMPSIVLNPKYLKVAQQLLDEVVNVKKAIVEQNAKKLVVEKEELGDQTASCDEVISELSKQGLQNKTTKLLSMLDEVDRRYRQYYHQMQVVVSSFDMIAGPGAAKPYTALALQTISRHFRCLRDAINGQLHIVRKNLGVGEEDAADKVVGISRLRYVDHKLNQNRTLHQLRTWRPQRGLPEVSVSILRAWLFEHFLHPYPKDSDKVMLARQTGLTKNQVSNWFINARVRLWKPMVEEMYKEEAADAEMESNSSSETLSKTTVKTTADTQGEDLCQMMGSDTNSSFQDLLQRNYGVEENQTIESSLFPDESNCGSNDRFVYNMTELERFGNSEGVSLTLGLQQMRDNEVYNTATADLGTERKAEFEPLDSGKQQPHRFMSPLTSFSRLL